MRWGGMPEMTFEWALRENGIDPKNDLVIDTSVAFAAMEGAFIGGNGDFVTLFELSVREWSHKVKNYMSFKDRNNNSLGNLPYIV